MAELGGHPTAPEAAQRPEVEEATPDRPGQDAPDDRGEDDEDQRDVEDEVEDELDAAGRHARRPLPSARRAASWAGDRTPAAAHGLTVGGRHLAVLGLLLAAGLLLAGWSYLRATGGPDPGGAVVAPRASGGVAVAPTTADRSPAEGGGRVAGPAAEAGASGAAQGTAGEVVVDVEGKVRRPGIAVLPAGSRVADALEAAGGARPGTDLQALNLARVLVDGEQLLVGTDPPVGVAAGSLTGPSAPAVPGTAPPGAATGAGPPAALVNLNTADQVALETLPGVGPVTAVAILEWRTQHGAFTSVDELLEVSGIGDATLAEIAPHVTL